MKMKMKTDWTGRSGKNADAAAKVASESPRNRKEDNCTLHTHNTHTTHTTHTRSSESVGVSQLHFGPQHSIVYFVVRFVFTSLSLGIYFSL